MLAKWYFVKLCSYYFIVMFFLFYISGTILGASYNIIDLGIGDSSYPVDINNSGQVIGHVTYGEGNPIPYLYNPDTSIEYPWLMSVHSLNNLGMVVGESLINGNAMIYYNGVCSYLDDDLYNIPSFSHAYAINDSVNIVGDGVNYGVEEFPFGYVYSSMDNYKFFGGDPPAPFWSCSTSINNNGQVVGWAWSTVQPGIPVGPYPILYAGGDIIRLYIAEGLDSMATKINDNEDILIYVSTEGPYLYNNGQFEHIPNFYLNTGVANHANDINNRGQVVGNGFNSSNGNYSGYIYNSYSDDLFSYDLNNLVDQESLFNIISADAINDYGQIAATGEDASGVYHTIILNPSELQWSGDNDNNWNKPENWGGGSVPANGSHLTFSGLKNQININNSNINHVGLITLSNGGFYISGNPLILNFGILSTGNNHWAINSTLAFPQTFASTSGTLTISGNINNNGNLLTISGSGGQLISGIISGDGGLIKNDTGTLTLSGINTYYGDTTINEGLLVLDDTGQILNSSITNNATFNILSGNHIIREISGYGSTEIISGSLMVGLFYQDVVTIGAGAKLIIAPRSSMGSLSNPFIPAPEPSTIALLCYITSFTLLYFRKRIVR